MCVYTCTRLAAYYPFRPRENESIDDDDDDDEHQQRGKLGRYRLRVLHEIYYSVDIARMRERNVYMFIIIYLSSQGSLYSVIVFVCIAYIIRWIFYFIL